MVASIHLVIAGTLLNLETQNLIWVDLNCILHANAIVLSEWYRFFGKTDKHRYYKSIANKLKLAIDKVRRSQLKRKHSFSDRC